MVVDRLALNRKNGGIRFKQVFALHAGAARTGTDQQRIVAVPEGNVRVVRRDDPGKRAECAVVQLHTHAVQGAERWRNFKELQDNRLVFAEHLARRNAEGELIADLAGSARDGDANG